MYAAPLKVLLLICSLCTNCASVFVPHAAIDTAVTTTNAAKLKFLMWVAGLSKVEQRNQGVLVRAGVSAVNLLASAGRAVHGSVVAHQSARAPCWAGGHSALSALVLLASARQVRQKSAGAS
jgi:predicted MFS family arabinose efflux permease